ncbi:hypothetical protein [Paraburkholderia sp. A1RO-1]
MAKDDPIGFSRTGSTMINAINSVGLKGDRLTAVFRGDTMSYGPSVPGIGVFEEKISDADRRTMFSMRDAICAMKNIPAMRPGNPGLLLASVTCPDGRHMPNVLDITTLPRDVNRAVLGPTGDLIEKLYRTGTPLARLDAAAKFSIENGKPLFIFAFKNSGLFEKVAFKSPSTWEGEFNPMSKSSNISTGGAPVDGSAEEFSVTLGAKEFLNAADFPDGIVEIPPGETRILKFSAQPDNRIPKGQIEIGGTITIKEILAPKLLEGAVEFRIPNSISNITEAYPSTRQEVEQLETYRRKLLWDSVHPPGATVSETAYYRGYGSYRKDAERDDYPQLLRKNEKFPERTMRKSDGVKVHDAGPVKIWRWDAFPKAADAR